MKKLLVIGALAAVLFSPASLALAEENSEENIVFQEEEYFVAEPPSPPPAEQTPAPAAPTPSALPEISPSAGEPAPRRDFTGSFYLSGSGGVSYLADSDNTGSGGLSVDSNHDRGYQFAGALGLRINQDFRVETELGYRVNDADSLTVNGAGALAGLSAAADGEITAMSLMLNGYGDMDIFSHNKNMNYIKPYIMGGIGMARIDADVSGGGVQMVDDDDTAFAYQIGLGIGYSFSETTAFDLGYRYFAVSNLEFNDAAGNPFDSEYNNHTVLIGLRHEFR